MNGFEPFNPDEVQSDDLESIGFARLEFLADAEDSTIDPLVPDDEEFENSEEGDDEEFFTREDAREEFV